MSISKFAFVVVLVGILSSFDAVMVFSCTETERHSLGSLFVSSSTTSLILNWSSTDCCQWEGVSCTSHRVTRLWLPDRGISATLSGASLANLTFLTHLNLSNNRLSGDITPYFFSPNHLRTLDLSSNRFNGFLPLHFLTNPIITHFNISNNSFTGPFPSAICRAFPILKVLDLTMNRFTGPMVNGIGECSHLQVLRAGLNNLSGELPPDLYSIPSLQEISVPHNRLSGPISAQIGRLSNLTVLQLHVNEFTGGIPSQIGLLSKLEEIQLHTNSLNGTLPHSLTGCSILRTLLLRNNHLTGDISDLDFSKLQRLEAIDLGNNNLTGQIPVSLCLCRSLTAVRFAYNRLIGEIPACLASVGSLEHFSVSDNFLSNVVGALKTLRHCDKLAVLFMSRCFHDEKVPDDDDLYRLSGFQNLQILTLGGCRLTGRIPAWIAKLRKVKVLNLSYNNITGPIPAWIGDLPNLFVLNLTQNYLSGEIPREIGRLEALKDDYSRTDLSSLALPFLFDSLQYNRLFNLPRGLKVGYNRLSGSIPEEIGELKLLHILDLNNNSFSGRIPEQLSHLVNLEKLDLSGNHLSGEIPESLTELHFLSSFSVADNDLEGEIPRKGQFDTFTASSFEGNPKLCGSLISKNCHGNGSSTSTIKGKSPGDTKTGPGSWSWYHNLPFGVGYLVGFLVVATSFLLNAFSWRRICCGRAHSHSPYIFTPM